MSDSPADPVIYIDKVCMQTNWPIRLVSNLVSEAMID